MLISGEVHKNLHVAKVHDCILILNIVYNNCGYIDVVQRMVDMSMTNAVEDVKEIPGYLDNGEVCQL